MEVMVTLQQIKDAHPCTDGWKKVLKANGGTAADFNKPFPLISVLDSNDLDDTLWVISSVPEMEEYDEIWRKLSTWCALQNIEKVAKYCSSEDYELIVRWLETGDLDIRESVRSAAWSAASSAAWSAAASAAESAAASAAESAASSAAWSAAASAAESAAASAAESAASSAAESAARSEQEKYLRELLS